jgi:hypothetical protein
METVVPGCFQGRVFRIDEGVHPFERFLRHRGQVGGGVSPVKRERDRPSRLAGRKDRLPVDHAGRPFRGCLRVQGADEGFPPGKLQVESENRSRGFGFGGQTLDAALAKRPKPTVANGSRILRDCRQGGFHTTKYSNICDLKSGDMFLYPLPGRDDQVKLCLAEELKKGAHHYEMPQIREQLVQAPRPSPVNMRRFPLDEVKPILDQDPKVTAHLRAMVEDASQGTSHADDFTAEMWKRISALPKASQADLRRFGDLVSMTLVERSDEGGQRLYYYRTEFANATVLQQFVLDGQNKVASGNLWVDVAWKPGANGGAP